MSLKDYNKGRNDGLALALRVARDGGVEALEKEIKMRGITDIHTSLSMKEIEEVLTPIKVEILNTTLRVAVATIRDEFGFGKSRIQRFINRFTLKIGCLFDNLFTLDESDRQLMEETGIQKIEFNWVDDEEVRR